MKIHHCARYAVAFMAAVLALAPVAIAADEGAPPLITSPEQARAAQQQWATKLGKPVEWTNAIGMKFVLIPPGEYVMGGADSDATPHRVRLTQPFYMGKFEVTREQYQGVTKTVYSTIFPGQDQPINFISWYEATSFAGALSKAEKVKYRMPTEAEWEFAARAGASTVYQNGDDAAGLAKVSWYDMNAGQATHPVGQKPANAFGLHDMAGNVWEWCSDFYEKDYYQHSPLENPTGPASSIYGYRVVRGGSAMCDANACKLAHRDYYQDSRSANHFGFRIVLPIETAPGSAAAAPAPATPEKK